MSDPGKVVRPEAISNYEANFAGCLIGLAVGQALGWPVKGLSRPEISQRYGHDLPSINTTQVYSENIALAFVHAISIIETGGKIDPFDFGPRAVTEFESHAADFRPDVIRQALTLAALSGNYQPALLEEPDSNAVAVRLASVGLLNAYGRFDQERFGQECTQAARLTHGQSQVIEGGIVVAAAVRLLCRNDLLVEDLMSAALDYLPFGLPSENPLREKLLNAQDYLEERQTLVDNIQAGNLDNIDLFRVDLNNIERCGTGPGVAETVAAAFYAFTARKESFEEAVTLAVKAGGESQAITAVTGAIAGAYHGLTAIPEGWRSGLPGYAEKLETSRRLNKTARSRELTDYLNAGI